MVLRKKKKIEVPDIPEKETSDEEEEVEEENSREIAVPYFMSRADIDRLIYETRIRVDVILNKLDEIIRKIDEE